MSATNAPSPHAPPLPGTIEDLVEAELRTGAVPRGGEPWLKHPPRDLCGLALSGGGIRSATFNLGLLQGLDRLGLLSKFDYVSTVSGGGYVGGFWTRWRHRQHEEIEKEKKNQTTPPSSPLTFPVGSVAGRGPEGEAWPDPDEVWPEPDAVRHLREYSNFLAPRTGLFSYDTGRMLVAACGSMLPALLAVLALFVLALCFWLLLASLTFGAVGDPWLVSTLTLLVLTVIVGAAFEWFWRRRRENGSLRDYALVLITGALLSAACWVLLTGAWTEAQPVYTIDQVTLVFRGAGRLNDWAYLFAPCAAWLGAGGVFVVVRTLVSRRMTKVEHRQRRGAMDRVLARLLFLAAVWAVVALVWCAGVLLHGWVEGGSEFLRTSGVAGLIAGLTAFTAKVQRVIGREPNRPPVGRLARVTPLLLQVASYSAIALMVAGTAALLIHLAGGAMDAIVPASALGTVGHVALDVEDLAIAFLVAGLLTAGAIAFFDPNEVGLHGFYRTRLARAYCGAAARSGERRTERRTDECADDDVPLNELGRDLAPAQPFPLICCAANDLGSNGIANLYRGARSAVLSPVGFSVGSGWARWPQGHAAPSLAAAMTASGAAFNSLMGAYSVRFGPGVTFLLAAFNLRLGLWWTHPAEMRKQDTATLKQKVATLKREVAALKGSAAALEHTLAAVRRTSDLMTGQGGEVMEGKTKRPVEEDEAFKHSVEKLKGVMQSTTSEVKRLKQRRQGLEQRR